MLFRRLALELISQIFLLVSLSGVGLADDSLAQIDQLIAKKQLQKAIHRALETYGLDASDCKAIRVGPLSGAVARIRLDQTVVLNEKGAAFLSARHLVSVLARETTFCAQQQRLYTQALQENVQLRALKTAAPWLKNLSNEKTELHKIVIQEIEIRKSKIFDNLEMEAALKPFQIDGLLRLPKENAPASSEFTFNYHYLMAPTWRYLRAQQVAGVTAEFFCKSDNTCATAVALLKKYLTNVPT